MAKNEIITPNKLKYLRLKHARGTRIRLLNSHDEDAPPPGTLGTVVGVGVLGLIAVRWDDGSEYSLIYNKDKFEKVRINAKYK